MSYAYELENGQQLVIDNEGDTTQIALSSGSENQRQSQATGFDTGQWTKAPALYRLKKDLVLRLEAKAGVHFIRIRRDEIRRMNAAPELKEAEKLRLKKSDQPAGMKPMEPMKPLKPLGGMRPMEMRMGDMHMQMGGGEEEPQWESTPAFCTQCGKPVREGDRFCAYCGHALHRS